MVIPEIVAKFNYNDQMKSNILIVFDKTSDERLKFFSILNIIQYQNIFPILYNVCRIYNPAVYAWLPNYRLIGHDSILLCLKPQ